MIRRSLGRLLIVATITLAGCVQYGRGPQPQSHEDKIAACGALPAGWRSEAEKGLRDKANSSLTAGELTTLKVTVGDPYRARSYRGLINYGHFAYGWAVPLSIQWKADNGNAREWSDTLLWNTNAESGMAHRVATGVEKVE
jgi:hypothetical protein